MKWKEHNNEYENRNKDEMKIRMISKIERDINNENTNKYKNMEKEK